MPPTAKLSSLPLALPLFAQNLPVFAAPKGLPQLPEKKDTFEPAPGELKAKEGDEEKIDTATLLEALKEEKLFGAQLSAYQGEKSKKYLRVTMALEGIRKFIGGKPEYVPYSIDCVVDWLSNPELLKDPVAHQARVSLLKVLETAQKKPELKAGAESLHAFLAANYKKAAGAKSEAAKDPFKDKDELKAALTDEKVFGEKYDTYKKESEKKPKKGEKAANKYEKIAKALNVVRAFSRGEMVYLDLAQDNLAGWLYNDELRNDPVAHQARVSLINALERAPSGEAEWNNGVGMLIKILRANYTKPKKEEASID